MRKYLLIASILCSATFSSGVFAQTDSTRIPSNPSMTYGDVAARTTWDRIEGKPATATRWPSWEEVSERPLSFPPTTHNHDSRYLQLGGGNLTGNLNIDGDFTIRNGGKEVFHVSDGGDVEFSGAFKLGRALRLRKNGNFDFLPTHADPRNADRPIYLIGDNFGGYRASILMERYVDPEGKGPGAVKDGGGIVVNRSGGKPGDLKPTPPGQVATLLGRIYDHETDNFPGVGSITIHLPEQDDTIRKGEIHFSVNDGEGSDVQRFMVLTPEGRLGIGSPKLEPEERLHVEGGAVIGVETGNPDMRSSVLNPKQGYFQSNSGLDGAGHLVTPWVYTRAIEADHRGSEATMIALGDSNGYTKEDQIGFVTFGELQVLIDRHGRLGIGTDTPKQALDVHGDAIADAWLQRSDERLKKEVEPVENSLGLLASVNGVTFQFTDDADETRKLGLIAQDVRKVFPEAVVENEDGYLSVDYPSLVAPLINAVNELNEMRRQDQAEIKELREVVSKLQDTVEGYESK